MRLGAAGLASLWRLAVCRQTSAEFGLHPVMRASRLSVIATRNVIKGETVGLWRRLAGIPTTLEIAINAAGYGYVIARNLAGGENPSPHRRPTRITYS